MATAINSGNAARGADESYFFRMACAMAAVMVAGFSLQLAMGRSSFGAPLRVHAHAVIFFGWIVLFLTQARLASRGNFALHRRLGQLAALWMAAMVAAGLIVTVALVQEGRAPFFFYPQQFLIADPVNLLFFVGLTLVAVQHRRQPDWHMRLQICAFASLMGPGMRGRGIAFVLGGLTIANVIGVPAITALGQATDWRVAYLAVAAVFALTLGAIALVVPLQSGDPTATMRRELTALGRPQV